MKTNNSTRKGMVQAQKVPQSINKLLKSVFSGCEKVICTEIRSDQQAFYSFSGNGLVIKFSIEEGGQA